MDELTPKDRAEWISEADETIRAHTLLNHCDAVQAYEELRTQRVWRCDPVAAAILWEAFLTMK
ncbi:hypothetical protein BJF89_06160 [Corynebacterium sp. CNJ-954]|nr:hypothetical protein BJF89_06160 [Corynebacterium sp. CNJ-954]